MTPSEIKYIHKIVPEAYHGTKLDVAKKIIREKKFHHSSYKSGDRPYLGKGIYFFESALSRAITWAENRFKVGEIGVIKAVINLGSCLDITDPNNIKLLIKLKKKLIKEKGLTSVTTAYVIHTCGIMYNVDTIRGLFPKGEPEGFHDVELIICVRNNNSIMEMSLVYEGVIR
ncbi:MAG: hypothetical protein M0P73_15495 [Syntrophobacterales bacterium]|jgi:hypothetical protein|nr:hypothetical protein [Syntrophobacterales bacterium]